MVREYARQNPGLLDSGEAHVTLPLTGYEQLPYDIDPPMSDWPIPRLPLADEWSDEPKDVQKCMQEVYTYHLINAVQSLARSLDHPDGYTRGVDPPVRDISVGFG